MTLPTNRWNQGRETLRAGPVRALARSHQLLAYIVVTFGLSWTYWVPVLGFLRRTELWWILPGAFAPSVAAIMITGLLEGRTGAKAFLRRLVLWRIGPWWYVFAVIVLPLAVAVAGSPFGDGSERLSGSFGTVAGTYLAYLGFLAVLGGGQEEPGWRGFALPRLQERFGPVIGSIVLGLMWGLWHLPVFLFVPNYNSAGDDPAGIALTFLVFTMAGTVGQSLLLTWLYNHTRGSLLIAVLAHASLNAGWMFVAMTTQASITVYLVLGAAGAVVAIATRGRLGRRSRDRDGHPREAEGSARQPEGTPLPPPLTT